MQIENHIRTFFRKVVLDHCQSVVDRAFWLGRILKPWPMVHQARFLFMLYGPEYNGIGNFNFFKILKINLFKRSDYDRFTHIQFIADNLTSSTAL